MEPVMDNMAPAVDNMAPAANNVAPAVDDMEPAADNIDPAVNAPAVNAPAIPTLVEQYVAEYKRLEDCFKAACDIVKEESTKCLQKHGVLHTPQGRIKSDNSLRNKLKKLPLIQRDDAGVLLGDFVNLGDVENRVNDLIGVRMLLYFPSQAEHAKSALINSLQRPDFPLLSCVRGRCKVVKKNADPPMTAETLLQNLSNDYAMKMLSYDVPDNNEALLKQAKDDGASEDQLRQQATEEQHEPSYGNYRAFHIRFDFDPSRLSQEQLQKVGHRRLRVEIQIQSLMMHSWSEVNHDLAYKQLNGKPTHMELRLLDCVNAIGKVSELALERLRALTIMRQKEGRKLSRWVLGNVIHDQIEDLDNDSNPGKPHDVGDVLPLVNYMRWVNVNQQHDIFAYLATWRDTRPLKYPVANAILEQMLRDSHLERSFTQATPFMLGRQNRMYAHANIGEINRYEILARILVKATKSIQVNTDPGFVYEDPLHASLAKLKTDGDLWAFNYSKFQPDYRRKLFDPVIQNHIRTAVTELNHASAQDLQLSYDLRAARIEVYKLIAHDFVDDDGDYYEDDIMPADR